MILRPQLSRVSSVVQLCSGYSSCAVKLAKKKKKPIMKLSSEVPACITDLLPYAAGDVSAPASVLTDCARDFGQLPDHERWARCRPFMAAMQGCLEKPTGTDHLRSGDIMKLIECSRFFAVPPSSDALHAYLTPLANRYAALTPAQKFLSPMDIASLSGGMCAMTNETPSLEPLLREVMPVLSAWKGKLTGRDAHNCMYGLRGLDSDVPLSLAYLDAVAMHIKDADWRIWEMHIMVASFSGLQRMSDDVPMVKDLLDYLCTMYLKYDKPYHSFAVGNALLGLLKKNCTVGVAETFVNRLVDEIDAIAKNPETTLMNLEFLQHRTALIFPMLHVDEALRARVQDVLLTIRKSIEVFRKGILTTDTASQLEDEIISNLKKRIAADGRILLTTNEFLHGFESDIVFRFPDATSDNYKYVDREVMKTVVVNVEIDGPNHSKSHSQFLDSMRDKYLRDRGIIVIRLQFDGKDSRNKPLADILGMAVQKDPSLEPLLGQFTALKEDFGDSFVKGKKCKSNVRLIRGPEDFMKADFGDSFKKGKK
jgi:hypothetical protein